MFYRQHKPKSYALIAIRLLLKLYLKVFPIRRSQAAQAPVNRKPRAKKDPAVTADDPITTLPGLVGISAAWRC